MPSKYSFDLLPKFTERWIPKPEQDPWQLQPDNLYFEVEVSASEILLTGLLIKLVLSFKDNYFSDYDKVFFGAKIRKQMLIFIIGLLQQPNIIILSLSL